MVLVRVEAKFVVGIKLNPVDLDAARRTTAHEGFRGAIYLHAKVADRSSACIPGDNRGAKRLVQIAGGDWVGAGFQVGSYGESGRISGSATLQPRMTCIERKGANDQ